MLASVTPNVHVGAFWVNVLVEYRLKGRGQAIEYFNLYKPPYHSDAGRGLFLRHLTEVIFKCELCRSLQYYEPL